MAEHILRFENKWVKAVSQDKLAGPSAWDGYAACVAADTINRSRGTGMFLPIEMIPKPEIYL